MRTSPESSDHLGAAEDHAPLLSPDPPTAYGVLPLPLESGEGRVERWFTPSRVLLVFSLLNFLTYFDRGAVAGSMTAIKVDEAIRGGDSSLSDTQSGVIISGFMIGYMCTCPLFAALGAYIRAKHIILIGMLVWSAACLSTALSVSYRMLLLSRFCVGVGEAAFVGFAVTIIDGVAPAERRTLWIGIFYSLIPVGTAAGMTAGGLLSEEHSLLGTSLQGWRSVFIGAVAAAVPALFTVAALPRRYDVDCAAGDSNAVAPLHGAEPNAATVAGGSAGRAYLPLHKATVLLLRNTNYLLIVAGYAVYCFVVGAVSVWAIPMLAHGPMHLPVAKSALVVGVVTSVGGIGGSLFGGYAVDLWGGSAGKRGSAKCQLFSAGMLFLCFPCGVAALFQTELTSFAVAFLSSVLALFSITAPINASILSVVPHVVRPYAVSYSVFLIHLLGDFPSPTVTGVLSDRFNRGCADYSKEIDCREAPAFQDSLLRRRLCHWVGGDTAPAAEALLPSWIGKEPSNSTSGKPGHCVNTYQTRDALLTVFAFLVAAIPCWITVSSRLHHEAREGEQPARAAAAASAVDSVALAGG